MMTPLALLSTRVLFTFLTTTTLVTGLKYDAKEAEYNLNTNRTAINPLHYNGSRAEGFEYMRSPQNWRFPYYTLFLDRFVNGDPTNDNANETLFETDMMSTQLRFGGDLAGLTDSLDYIAGMGIKVTWLATSRRRDENALLTTRQGIYIAGSPFINQPWGADQYSVCLRGKAERKKAGGID